MIPRFSPVLAVVLVWGSLAIHAEAREYDPRVGRFLQKEPILEERYRQHYLYARLSPTEFSDPTGRLAKREWQDKAVKGAKIDMVVWGNTTLDWKLKRPTVIKVYDWYQKVWKTQRSRFHWAGLARVTGAAVVGGLDLMSRSQKANPFKRAVGMERMLVGINKDIFDDLGWQHMAYIEGGIEEMRERRKAGELTQSNLEAWENIDGQADAARWKGNLELLRREQAQIAQKTYTFMKNRGWGSELNKAINPIPGNPGFKSFMPNGNMIVFGDRWKWIVENIWDPWKKTSFKDRRELINMKLDELHKLQVDERWKKEMGN